MYIGDLSHRVRKVTISTGIITTVAGGGNSDSVDSGVTYATSAAIYYPYAVAVDSSGKIILLYTS